MALALLVLVLAACQPTPAVPTYSTTKDALPPPTLKPTMTSSTTVVNLGAGIELSVAGTVEGKTSPEVACSASIHALSTAIGDFQAVLIAPECDWSGQPGNGNHGFYLKAPATATVERVATPIGDAAVFSNEYTECTNSCHTGTDEVALVTVGTRVVQVIAVTAPANGTKTRDRSALVNVLQWLRKA